MCEIFILFCCRNFVSQKFVSFEVMCSVKLVSTTAVHESCVSHVNGVVCESDVCAQSAGDRTVRGRGEIAPRGRFAALNFGLVHSGRFVDELNEHVHGGHDRKLIVLL